MRITAFLNHNCRPLMVWYYKRKYKWQIFKVLQFVKDYQDSQALALELIIETMMLDKDNWTMEYSAKIVGVCIYCDFIAIPEKEIRECNRSASTKTPSR